MVCGPQGSGKSTYTKELIDQGFISLNRDTEGGNIASLLPKLEQHLKDGKNVVLDNTFPSIEVRKPFIDLCKQYNADISCKVMDIKIEDAQFNVAQRMIDILGHFPTHEEIKKSKHPNIFPVVVLFKYKKEYQKPTTDEGFSKVEFIKFKRKHNPEFINKALILDYDSTIRDCIGGNGKYPTDESHVQVRAHCTKIIEDYRAKGYKILGISNQSGVAKGELTYEKAVSLFEHTNKLLGTEIDFNFCHHQSAPPVCYCRKPQVGLFVMLMNKYKLNPAECLFVGDYKTDETLAKRCGMPFMYESEFFKQ